MLLYEREERAQLPEGGALSAVLFATDGSRAAQAAQYEAIHLARSRGAPLVVLYVIDSRFGRRVSHLLRAALADERDNGRRSIREVLDAARRQGVAARGMLVSGRPGEVVCQIAERAGADLVVMRAGALDTGRGLTDGSTSDYVLRHSPRPVCLVGTRWQPGLGVAR